MKPLLLSFLAGAVGACGFQPAGLWPVTLAALVLLIMLIERAPSLKSALARGWWFGSGHFTIGLNWIATSFTYQANMPAWLGWIAVVLVSLCLSVYPAAAAGIAWRHGRRRPLAFALLFAAGWIVTEWLRASLFTGFAWNPLGVTLIATPVARFATLVGTYGLSGIVILIAAMLWLMIRQWWRSAISVGTAIAAGTLLFLVFRSSIDPGPGVRVRIVQPNIGQEEKWQAGNEGAQLRRLAAMTGTVDREPRLILWPEATVTLPLEDQRTDPYYALRVLQIRRAVAQLLGPGDLLLTGGITIRSADGTNATSGTNSVFALDRSGRILARYDKAHLVPYGEYLPMRPLLSALGLSRLAPGDVDFDHGPGPQTLRLPLVGAAGFQLCYEIIFSGQVVDRAQRPAFLFNPSNDAWFGAWGPPQHLAQARLRALEEGLPVLRATPTGISAVIDAEGRLLHTLPWRTQGVIDARLPAARPATIFARVGNFMPLLFALSLLFGAIAVRREHG